MEGSLIIKGVQRSPQQCTAALTHNRTLWRIHRVDICLDIRRF